MLFDKTIEKWDTMYPSAAYLVEKDAPFTAPKHAKFCSVYGYCFGDTQVRIDDKVHKLEAGQYFAFFAKDSIKVKTDDKAFLVVRLGYKVTNQTGWIEPQGRLTYIDGCTDSLLVFPARLGDASLNLLYFPPGIDQTFHIHPSIRLGCVARGNGFSNHGDANNATESPLTEGNIFCLEENERHRFRTAGESMTVIAFHPDGDWGPTDHNHTMLNRTYINK
jgi:quercetin dioxygenase-like cupin family protein